MNKSNQDNIVKFDSVALRYNVDAPKPCRLCGGRAEMTETVSEVIDIFAGCRDIIITIRCLECDHHFASNEVFLETAEMPTMHKVELISVIWNTAER